MESYMSMLTNEVSPEVEVILHITDKRWLLPLQDAYVISSLLNASLRISSEYTKGGYLEVTNAPEPIARISPVTGRDRIAWEANAKTIQENKK